jgi:hypothetical protein
VAKVSYGPTVTEARGKAGDVQFQKSRGGNTVRALRVPTAEAGFGDGARVYNSADLTISTGVETALTFNSERYDYGGLHDPASNPSRLTAQKAGVYIISASILWASGAAGARGLYLKKNGATLIAQEFERHAATDYCAQAIATVYKLAANDYVQVIVIETGAATLKVLAVADTSPEFTMQQVRSA